MEVDEVVKRKFPESSRDVRKILHTLRIVETGTGDEALKLIRDKKDAPILAAALKHMPDCLVAGDRAFHTHEIKGKNKRHHSHPIPRRIPEKQMKNKPNNAPT